MVRRGVVHLFVDFLFLVMQYFQNKVGFCKLRERTTSLDDSIHGRSRRIEVSNPFVAVLLRLLFIQPEPW